jgi:hypothetical protein
MQIAPIRSGSCCQNPSAAYPENSLVYLSLTVWFFLLVGPHKAVAPSLEPFLPEKRHRKTAFHFAVKTRGNSRTSFLKVERGSEQVKRIASNR